MTGETLLRDYRALDSATIRDLYKHVTMLVNSKYKNSVKVLAQRNVGYSKDDFIQETMHLLLDAFSKKSFSSITKLKNYAFKVMEFHYLKEKRKFYYTKQRGSMQCVSMEEPVFLDGHTQLCYKHVLPNPIEFDMNNIDLYNIKTKNLQLVIKNGEYIVVEPEDLKYLQSSKNITILSINRFIALQHSHGFRESCRYYKNMGFNMKKSTYETINNVIIDYLKQKNFIDVVPSKREQKEQKSLCLA